MRRSDKPDQNATSTQDPFDRALTTLLKLAQHDKAAGCETWNDFLPIIARGERLSSEESHDALMWHLAFCKYCRAEVKALMSVSAPRPSLKDRLRAVRAWFEPQLAAASAAAATETTETVQAVVQDAQGNPTNERVMVEVVQPSSYIDSGGFHVILKAPVEFRGATVTAFVLGYPERYLFPNGFTATVDENGYVVMSGEDIGEDFGEDVEKIETWLLEITIQRKE